MWRGLRLHNDLMESSGEGKRGRRERVSGLTETMMYGRGHGEIAQLRGKHFVWEPRRGGGKGGEVGRSFLLASTSISQCFPRRSPRTSPPFPFQRLSLHLPLYMWQKAFTHPHTYRVWALAQQKGSCGLPMTTFGGSQWFSSAACVSLCKVNESNKVLCHMCAGSTVLFVRRDATRWLYMSEAQHGISFYCTERA